MVKISGGDGLSLESAIEIKDCSNIEGVDFEYKILREKFGTYRLIKQSLLHIKEKAFDVLEIELADGTKKRIYFDITDFFGKGFEF